MHVPSPPDGARLSAFDVRRGWLSRPDLAYHLPERGLAVFPGPEMYPFWVVDGTGAHRHDGPERVVPVSPPDHLPWATLWLMAPVEQGVTVVLRYDGLFLQTRVSPARWLRFTGATTR